MIGRTSCFGALLVALTLSGCAGDAKPVRTSGANFPATDASQVEILLTPPKRDYVEVGRVGANNVKESELNAGYATMRSQAAQFGANAVIVTKKETAAGFYVLGQPVDPKVNVVGLAIRYR